MQYKKQLMYGAAVLAVAAVFLGLRQWQLSRLAAEGWPDLEGGFYTEPVTRGGVTAYVPMDDVYDSGLSGEGIPALNEPEYVSVAAADAVIADDLYGIAIEVEGEHLYYPVQILNWHEAVNETVNGVPLLITYCPMCGSGVVYERETSVTFSVSGKVYNDNTLLTDSATNSLWSQAVGLAVSGEAAGERMTVYPSEFVKWSDWKDAHPDGSVLSSDTGYTRDYTRHPYGNYDRQTSLYFPVNKQITLGSPKWHTTVYATDAGVAAFAREVMPGKAAIEMTLGEQQILGLYDHEDEVVRVFDRTVNGSTYTFTFDYVRMTMKDNETGSTWNVKGEATAGQMKGARLTELEATEYYWFCAQAMFPQATIAGVETVSAGEDDRADETIEIETEVENAGT